MTNPLPKLDLATPLVTPSDGLVNSVLKRTVPQGKGQEFIMKQWYKMQAEQPGVAHFIATTTFRMAPDNPFVREKIAIGMVRLYILMSEASLQKDVASAFKESFTGQVGLSSASGDAV